MSTNDNHSDTMSEAEELTFTVNLTYIKAVTGNSKKTQKEVKTKDFDFALTPDAACFVSFENQLLAKYNEDKHKVIHEGQAFPFKYYYPGQNKSEAISIDGLSDFMEMVQRVENMTDKERGKIVILANMSEIISAGQQMVEASESIGAKVTKTSAQEAKLARYQLMIENAHRNKTGDGFLFNFGDGNLLPLTPALIKEWSCGLYDGLCTIHHPPNTPGFDPAHRNTALTNRSTKSPFHIPNTQMQGDGGIEQLTKLMGAVGQLVQGTSGRSTMASMSASPVDSPSGYTTPTHHCTSSVSTPTELLAFSPSDTTRYLQYSEEHLGVKNALQYNEALWNAAYSPNMLHKVCTPHLDRIGIKHGDIVHLKSHAEAYWAGPEPREARKRRLQEGADEPPRHPPNPANPPISTALSFSGSEDGVVAYEIRYPNGGGKRVYGGPPEPGYPSNHDKRTFWHHEVTGKWHPLPAGHTFVERHEPLPGQEVADEDLLFQPQFDIEHND